MKIYVASSWRNQYQPEVVKKLREAGHEVYDFKDADGFNWTEIDVEYQKWNPQQYLKGLQHEAAERGYGRDIKALDWCDCCVMVMPCGMSASLETGYARGQNKLTIVYIPELREPDLMIKMAHRITTDFAAVLEMINAVEGTTPLNGEGL